MKTKVQFLLVALSMAFVVSVSAQTVKEPKAEEIAQKQTEQMAKHLSLTSDQQTKIQAINLKYVQQRQAARKNKKSSTETKEQMKADAEKSLAAQEAEFKGVLNEQQFQKYLQNKDVMKAKIKERINDTPDQP